MPGPAAILRELHRLRRHAKDLETELERGPRTLKLQQDREARQEDQAREAHDALKHLKVTIHDKEVSLKAKHQEIAKHQRQLEKAGSNKEYDALQAEIAAEQKTCQQLENEILEAMSEVEDRTAQLPQLEREVQRVKGEVHQIIEDVQTRRHQFTELLQGTRQQIQEVEATLPEDVRAQYLRLVTARGEDALAAAQGRICSACYTEITAQNYNDLLQGRFLICKNCDRILYLPESTAG
jgi:uncharacterized protein